MPPRRVYVILSAMSANRKNSDGVPVGIVRDDIFIEHKTDSYHPENPKRLEQIYKMLDEWSDGPELFRVPLRQAERGELERIHSSHHVDTIANTANMERFHLDGDTPTSSRSYEAALYAAGSSIEMVDHLLDGKISSGFALVRPPGHHAEADRAMGFCLFNNIAVSAAHARDVRGLEKILIVDWDLHHGNGTQHSFYADKRVLYFSAHQYPYYPGTGHYQEVGQGAGEGFTVNVPLTAGRSDEDYLSIFRDILEPVASEFQPQLVMVSAGFDNYMDDPLGHMDVTVEGFAKMAAILKGIADKYCGGKVLYFLEGGYNLQGLSAGVKRVLEVHSGIKIPEAPKEIEGLDERFSEYLSMLKSNFKTYWNSL